MRRTDERGEAQGEVLRGLESLRTKEAIREALYDELDAWRDRAWNRMRQGFASTARIEGALFGASPDPRATLPVDEALARLADAMGGQAASSLLVSNCRIELAADGERAQVASLILAAHEPRVELSERTRLEALRFEDDWIGEASDAGDRIWRVASRRVEILWQAWLDPRRDDRVGDHRNAEAWTR